MSCHTSRTFWSWGMRGRCILCFVCLSAAFSGNTATINRPHDIDESLISDLEETAVRPFSESDLSTGAASPPSAWVTAPQPSLIEKQCLCRYLFKGVETVDYLHLAHRGTTRCQSVCREYQQSAGLDGEHNSMLSLCAYYVRRATQNKQWILSSHDVEPHHPEYRRLCRELLPTSLPLNDYEMARVGRHSSATSAKRINFFFWGVPSEAYLPKAIQGPNLMARLLSNHGFSIHFFHQTRADVFSTGQAGLDDRISTHSIGPDGEIPSIESLLEDLNFDSATQDKVQTLVSVMDGMGTRAYAGIKDLCALIVGYRYGGFFFDTHLQLDPTGSQDRLLEGLESLSADSFPKWPIDQVRYLDKDGVDIDTYQTWEVHGEKYHMFNIEFNMFWAPKQHPVLRSAVEHYIAQAQSEGFLDGTKYALPDPLLKFRLREHTKRPDIDEDLVSTRWESLSRPDYISRLRTEHAMNERMFELRHSPRTFNTAIGVMIAGAVNHALIEYALMSHVNLGAMVFNTAQDPDTKTVSVPILGLIKHYGGTWRKAGHEATEEMKKMARFVESRYVARKG